MEPIYSASKAYLSCSSLSEYLYKLGAQARSKHYCFNLAVCHHFGNISIERVMVQSSNEGIYKEADIKYIFGKNGNIFVFLIHHCTMQSNIPLRVHESENLNLKITLLATCNKMISMR